jgi:membrane associated rhomboid family serine protease
MIPLTDEETRPNRTPYLTILLIAVNVWFFVTAREVDLDDFGLTAGSIVAGENLVTLFTSMFLHGGFFHLLFNIWSLWIFGDNVEEDLGPAGYLGLYFLSGIAGGYAFAFFAADPGHVAIGASGAISGIMGAYLILHPKNRILTLVPAGFFLTTLRINAPIFIGIWFLVQFAGFYLAAETGIAYSAHVGGFLAGVVLAYFLKPSIENKTSA